MASKTNDKEIEDILLLGLKLAKHIWKENACLACGLLGSMGARSRFPSCPRKLYRSQKEIERKLGDSGYAACATDIRDEGYKNTSFYNAYMRGKEWHRKQKEKSSAIRSMRRKTSSAPRAGASSIRSSPS